MGIQHRQLALVLLGFRNIPGNRGSPDNHTITVPDRRDGQRHIDLTAILSHTYRLEMIDALAASKLCQDLILFMQPFRGKKNGLGLTDDLLRRVAKYTLGAFVPRSNDGLKRLADDRVIGGI